MPTAAVKLFVLAGQSNVLGNAKTPKQLQSLIKEQHGGDSGEWAEFQDSSGSFVERDDVFVTFDRKYGDFDASLEGPLSAEGFGSVDGEFGPGFALDNPLNNADVV
jgi:hypothetical protein